MAEQKLTSIEIGRAALRIAVTENRAEEQRIKEQLAAKLALPAAASICALPYIWRWAC